MVIAPSQGPVLAQHLRVVGKDDIPAESVFQYITGAFLHQYVLGIFPAQIGTPP